MMQQNIATQNQKQLLMKAILIIYLNQSVLRSYQTYKNLLEGSGWIIDSVVNHTIDISKYNPLAGSSHIKLLKELPPKKSLINIQNTDNNKCFKWCLASYLHSVDYNSKRIKKVDKDFASELGFKDIHFPVKIRDIHKTKKNCIDISVFGYENKKNIQSMCQKILS